MNPEEAWSNLESFNPNEMADEGAVSFHTGQVAADKIPEIETQEEQLEAEESRLATFIAEHPSFDSFLDHPLVESLVQKGARVIEVPNPEVDPDLQNLLSETPVRVETAIDSAWSQNNPGTSWAALVVVPQAKKKEFHTHFVPQKRVVRDIYTGSYSEDAPGSTIQASLTERLSPEASQYALIIHGDDEIKSVEGALSSGWNLPGSQTQTRIYLVSNPSPAPPNAL